MRKCDMQNISLNVQNTFCHSTAMSPSLFTGLAVVTALLVFFCSEVVEPYSVFWNVPTHLCIRHGINFSTDLDKYGFTKNSVDYLHGQEITLLSSPGMFPALFNATKELSTVEDLIPRNGGIPQKGDLSLHLETLKMHIEKYIPDAENTGLVVIDFEEWFPLYELNNGSYKAYQVMSENTVIKYHPELRNDTEKIKAMAKEAFENTSKVFMSETLDFGTKIRTRAKWGYYKYPLCSKSGSSVLCSSDSVSLNDKIQWLYTRSSALFPLFDMNAKMSESDKTTAIMSQTKEVLRVARQKDRIIPIYAYIYYKYSDDHNLITQEDLEKLMKIPKNNGVENVVLWGPKFDFHTQQQCETFKQYLNNILGPQAKILLKKS